MRWAVGRQPLVAAEGQHGHGHGCEAAVEAGHDADSIAVGFLIVGIKPEGKGGPVHAPRRAR